MNANLKLKLNKILSNNKSWPIILEGLDATLIKDAVIIKADINSQDLGIKIDGNGYVYPNFINELENSENKILIIDKLDEISKEEQEKFYGLIKYKGINGYKFPKETQIIITTKINGLNKISQNILNLTLNFKLE